MGFDQCTKCKEYYNPCSTFEYNLSNPTFNNPFFPKDNESMNEKEKEFLNVNYNTNTEEMEGENDILKNMKKKILIKEQKKRKFKDNNNLNIINEKRSNDKFEEKDINEKINDLLESMCIYGNITKKEIIEEKQKNPQKFISTSDALQLEKDDQNLFALGLLSSNLKNIGIETAIEKENNNDELEESTTCLQFIFNGLVQKKKYEFCFELEEKRSENLLNSGNEFEKFKNDLIKKINKKYPIPEDKIIVTFPQKGSFKVQVIFQSDEYNELDIEDLKQKFINDEEFKDLKNLKEIHSEIIMGGCKLSKNQLDQNGNISEDWSKMEYHGKRPYNPPLGWIGIGLKVRNKYENDEWLRCSNSEDEWLVAYHVIGRSLGNYQVIDKLENIINSTFKRISGQFHKDCDDINNPGNKIGEGVYCTPNIDLASQYCESLEINGQSYKTVLMVKVNPKAIRLCNCNENYWVVNGTSDEIRPYMILYKVCN